jgi:hypothetical protein
MSHLGALQSETSPVFAGVLALGLLVVIALHLLAALWTRRTDYPRQPDGADGFVEVSFRSPVSKWWCSGMTGRSQLCLTSVSIKPVRLGRDASLTGASPVPGMAINTCQIPEPRLRPL